MFQHTAARRRLVGSVFGRVNSLLFQHTAARRRLAQTLTAVHRPIHCFNTQPPEGGWLVRNLYPRRPITFQHTAARRRLVLFNVPAVLDAWFQHTAARRRLALFGQWFGRGYCCFNTQPPEGGWLNRAFHNAFQSVFQHTAARRRLDGCFRLQVPPRGFNTQPPEGGWLAGFE